MISDRVAPIPFGFELSGMMSFLSVAYRRFAPWGAGSYFSQAWKVYWANSWATVFPVVLVVAPITRRLVARLVLDNK